MSIKQIIVIEDEAPLLLGLRLNLISLGFDVVCFDNGQKAYQEIIFLHNTGKSFDLLISDIDLPAINGVDLSRLLTKSNISIPTIFFSGYTKRELIKKFSFPLNVQFLPKPFSIIELLTYAEEQTQLKLLARRELV